jgi:translation initiation factor 5
MDTINIPFSINDPFYRYKMHVPKILIIKNISYIANIDTIAYELSRDKKNVMTFLSKTLACGIIKENGLRGTYTIDNILDKLSLYIKRYVLCGKCRNPETTYHNDQKLTCKACGFVTRIDK